MIGPLCGAVALVVYVVTLTRGAAPGRTAALVADYTGLFPQLSPASPVWGACVRALQAYAPFPIVTSLAILNALCGAAAVWLMYEVVAGLISAAIDPAVIMSVLKVRTASILAGLGASLFLAFSIPFWSVATRPDPSPLGVMFLLFSAWLLMRFMQGGRTRVLYLLMLVFGVGMVEFAAFIAMMPLLMLSLLFVLLRRKLLSTRFVVKLVLCGLVGIAVCVLEAWRFHGSLGYEFRGYHSFLHVIWQMWRDQLLLLSRILPRHGWLIILFLTIVPWVTMLIVARRALNEERDWSYYLLHLIITALAVVVLFDGFGTNWSMLGVGSRLVTPYVLTASVFGYVLAYWYLLPGCWSSDSDTVLRFRVRACAGIVVAMAGVVCVMLVPFGNAGKIRRAPVGLLKTISREIVLSMEGVDGRRRPWLLTDGKLDANLRIAALDEGVTFNAVDLSAGANEIYADYLARNFRDPALQNLARIGPVPFVEAWLIRGGDVTRKVTILGEPDLWFGAGLTAVPNKLLYMGTADPSGIHVGYLLEHHQAFWNRFLPVLDRAASRGGAAAQVVSSIKRHMARVANDLGVFCEDREAASEAFEAYAAARLIDKENISALLNQFVMVQNGFSTPEAGAIRTAVKELRNDPKRQPPFGVLVRANGYVRTPAAFVHLGMLWSDAGRPELAVAGYRRSLKGAQGAARVGIQRMLADVYLMHGNLEAGEDAYRRILKARPADVGAHVGLARILGRRGDVEAATKHVAAAESAGAEKARLLPVRAALELQSGNVVRARALLEGAENVRSVAVQVLLSEALILQRDERAFKKCMRTLEDLGAGEGLTSVLGGLFTMRQGDLQAARRFFVKARSALPNNPHPVECLARVDLLTRGATAAALQVRELLRHDPKSAFGNYVMGVVEMQDGSLRRAEAYFRTSLASARLPMALNDLAMLLRDRGGMRDEAVSLTREALRLSPAFYHAWDTLGLLLLGGGQVVEAERALNEALKLNRSEPAIFLHMAQVQHEKKNWAGVIGNVSSAERLPKRLSEEERGRLRTLRREAEEKGVTR